MTLTVNRVLLLLAVVVLAVAALGVGSLGPLATLPLGLCLWAASQLV